MRGKTMWDNRGYRSTKNTKNGEGAAINGTARESSPGRTIYRSLSGLAFTVLGLLVTAESLAAIDTAQITASPTQISEGDTSTFTVTLTTPNDTNTAADVVVTVSGSATLGVDYEIAGNPGTPISLQFLQFFGQSTQTLTVTALNDGVASEGDEDIVFTITSCTWAEASNTGNCPTGSSATVTITDATPLPPEDPVDPPEEPTDPEEPKEPEEPEVVPLATLPGLTGPQRSMAVTLDTLCPNLGSIATQRPLNPGEQDLLTQCASLFGNSLSNPGASTQGVAAITPEQATAPRRLTTQVTGAQLDNIATRLMALRRNARGISLGNLSVNVGGQSLSGDSIASLTQQAGVTGGGASADDTYEFERLGVFVNGNIDWGSKDRSTNEDGFDFSTLGITAGLDYRFLDGLVLGLALGYGDTDADIDSNGGDLETKAWSSTLYGTYYATDHFYLEGSATYGWGSFDQTRAISYGLLGGTRDAEADFDGNQYAFMLGTGYDFVRGGGILDLYGRLRYVRAELDGYRELGASGLDLDIASQEESSFTSVLGMNYTRSISTARAVLVPQAWFEWAHEFDSGDDRISGTFVNDPSRIPFILATDKFDSDYFRLGLGIGAQFGQGRTAFATYEAAIGLSNYTEHTVNIGARLEF